jgi:hypothetical protein
MKRFEVIVSRTILDTGTVFIEAENERQALGILDNSPGYFMETADWHLSELVSSDRYPKFEAIREIE